MPRTVTARFETEDAAERALAAVAAEVPLRDSAVVASGVSGKLTLDSLHLAPEERAACEQQLAKGGFLVLAQVVSEARGEAVIRMLNERLKESHTPAPAQTAPSAAPSAMPASAPEAAPQATPQPAPERVATPERAAAPEAPPPTPARAPQSQETVSEERIPIVEEELRIGKREVVRGRSRVQTFVEEVPVQEQVELLHEETNVERRPVNRRLTDEEVAQGGLLQERVIEITEMREEAVVTKEAFVREELIVSKNVHRRVEQIEETVRRTEVRTERLDAEDALETAGERP